MNTIIISSPEDLKQNWQNLKSLFEIIFKKDNTSEYIINTSDLIEGDDINFQFNIPFDITVERLSKKECFIYTKDKDNKLIIAIHCLQINGFICTQVSVHNLNDRALSDVENLEPKELTYLWNLLEANKKTELHFDEKYQFLKSNPRFKNFALYNATEKTSIFAGEGYLSVAIGNKYVDYRVIQTRRGPQFRLATKAQALEKYKIDKPSDDLDVLASIITSKFTLPSYNQVKKGLLFEHPKDDKIYELDFQYDIAYFEQNGEIIIEFFKARKNLGADGGQNQGIVPCSYRAKFVDGKLTILPKNDYGKRVIAKITDKEQGSNEFQILQEYYPDRNPQILSIPGTDNVAVLMKRIEGLNLENLREKFLKKQSGQKVNDLRVQIVERLIPNLKILNKIVHRDLKTENIMLQISGSQLNIAELEILDALLIDFGLSTLIKKQGEEARCGSPRYMPPEVISARLNVSASNELLPKALHKVTSQQDIWSLGIILIDIFCEKDHDKRFLDAEQDTLDLLYLNSTLLKNTHNDIATEFVPEFRQKLLTLLERILDSDWQERPSINDVISELTSLVEMYHNPENIEVERPCSVSSTTSNLSTESDSASDKSDSDDEASSSNSSVMTNAKVAASQGMFKRPSIVLALDLAVLPTNSPSPSPR